MKQFEATKRLLNGNTFYIRPFPAFTSANISGELFSSFTPMLGSLAPMVATATKGSKSSFLDMGAEEAAPMLAQGLSSLNGDKLERLLKKLLVKHNNISVELVGSDEVIPLNEDLANEIFCGNSQDMFILAFDVIKSNYSGFFENLGDLFGEHFEAFRNLLKKETPGLKNTAN